MAKEEKEDYKRVMIMALGLMALGVIFNYTMAKDSGMAPMGKIIIGLGALFLVVGWMRKRRQDRGDSE